MPRTPITIHHIQPEIIQTWEKAWQQQPTEESPYVLPCGTKQQAVKLRQSLYVARKKLIALHYEGASNWLKLEVHQVGGRLGSILHIRRDAWTDIVTNALKQVGGPVRSKDEIERSLKGAAELVNSEEITAQTEVLKDLFGPEAGERHE